MNKAIVGTKFMVVSPHYLASQAGTEILETGGNAFDAAVAVSACLAVVYPHMTGLGGDSFWLTYSGKTKQVKAYNGSGRSGKQATRQRYNGKASIPVRGIDSVVTVPGMVDSWAAILKKYGRLSLADVLKPAIEYAVKGFPLSKDQHENTMKNKKMLEEDPDAAAVFLPNNRVPAVYEKFVQENMGTTLKELAENGRDSFYKGDLAKKLVSALEQKGGLLTLEDFAQHSGYWTNPIQTSYREHDMYQVPPNSQGFTGLMTLNILENYDFSRIEHGSYEYFHLLVEALKKSFQDRNRYLTDPAFSLVPLEQLLSKAYGQQLAGAIQWKQASCAETQPVGSDTAHAAVVDAEGNAVSFIQSLYFEFGSGIVAGETGVIIQNRGSFFSLDPHHVNCLEPLKRTFHTLMPAMALKSGKPAVLYGTQGGEGQPQTQTAIITRILDYGMDPQTAINEPRFVWGRTWGAPTQELKLEGRISEKTANRLAAAGHIVKIVGDLDGVMGHANAIVIDEQRFFRGGIDPRGDGAAVGK